MSGIGHNNGPTMEPGQSWRRHVWTRARADLLPTLPIEVVRLRLKRAAEIGLDYRTYASFRAASGHDIVALLFSTNALGLLPGRRPPAPSLARLESVRNCGRGALARGLTPAEVLALVPVDHAAPAPRPFANWSEARAAVLSALSVPRWPADRVLMVGDAPDERGWAEAARLGGYLPADRWHAA